MTDKSIRQERPGESVTGLARATGSALAIIGGQSLCRRGSDGAWHTLATSEARLACCVAVEASIYVGTDEAQVLKMTGHSFEKLAGFERMAGRDRWYAGTALVDGRLVGPPLEFDR